MMYKFTWKDLGEVVAVEEVGFFAAMRLLRGEGVEDSDAALGLCRICVVYYPIELVMTN